MRKSEIKKGNRLEKLINRFLKYHNFPIKNVEVEKIEIEDFKHDICRVRIYITKPFYIILKPYIEFGILIDSVTNKIKIIRYHIQICDISLNIDTYKYNKETYYDYLLFYTILTKI